MAWQSAVNSLLEVKMKWTSNVSCLIKEVELRKSPVIIRVNKFDEDAISYIPFRWKPNDFFGKKL